MMEIEREGDEILAGLAELLNEDYEPNVPPEPQAIQTVDDPIFDDLSKYELQLRDSKAFNDKWGDAELRSETTGPASRKRRPWKRRRRTQWGSIG